MVFRNHRGRSIYQGRTTTPDRIENFMRTSRFIPQRSETLPKSDVLIRRVGRATIWAPINVTDRSGTPPEGLDATAFIREARVGIAGGPLPVTWVYDPARPGDPPQVQFRFRPPLDAYLGEVK